MIRVKTRNTERTISEMTEMWKWLNTNFRRSGFKNKWWYGKEPDWTGRTFCSDPVEIEWVEFSNLEDATLFLLRWA